MKCIRFPFFSLKTTEGCRNLGFSVSLAEGSHLPERKVSTTGPPAATPFPPPSKFTVTPCLCSRGRGSPHLAREASLSLHRFPSGRSI